MPSLLNLGVTVALSATGLLAHPLSNAQLVSRAEDVLPEYDYVIVGAGASGLDYPRIRVGFTHVAWHADG
jgi:predicted TIM-barrel enzyme